MVTGGIVSGHMRVSRETPTKLVLEGDADSLDNFELFLKELHGNKATLTIKAIEPTPKKVYNA